MVVLKLRDVVAPKLIGAGGKISIWFLRPATLIPPVSSVAAYAFSALVVPNADMGDVKILLLHKSYRETPGRLIGMLGIGHDGLYR